MGDIDSHECPLVSTQRRKYFTRVNRLFENLDGSETDSKEHNKRLEVALDRAKMIGMTLNPDKYKFRVMEVTYLGHKLTATGVRLDPSKVDAVLNMPPESDKSGVQRLLGVVNYLVKFTPGMSEITAPLREILKNNVPWHWTKKQQIAFEKIKGILATEPILKYYDVTKPVAQQTYALSKDLVQCYYKMGVVLVMRLEC